MNPTPATPTLAPPSEKNESAHRNALPEAIRRGKAFLISAVFIVLIWLPTLDWLFGLDHAPIPNEKRLLASFPKYTGLTQLRDFVSGLNQYYDDHFGFRKKLIRTNNRWTRKLFGGPPNNGPIMGRDGWLFYAGDKMLDRYMGPMRFSQKDLEAWQQLLEKRRDWLAKRGVKYIFTIPPDKHEVYPEYLPEWIVKGPKPSKVDQFVAHMAANSTVQVLYLRKALVEAKPLGVNYLKTDTHWNARGAFIGYQALLDALSRQIPDLKPLPLESYEQRPKPAPAGDLANMMGEGSAPETQQLAFVPRPPLHAIDCRDDPSRLPKQWRKSTDPCVSENPQAKGGKAIVFRDSFAGAWPPFLGNHFKEVVYIWQYYWDAAFLEREKPVVVIDEMLERFFNQENPNELMKKDGLD